jgi:branched-chain amino acid transport system substrate-binding protein
LIEKHAPRNIAQQNSKINVKGVEKMKKHVYVSLVVLFALLLASCAPAAAPAAPAAPAEEAPAEEAPAAEAPGFSGGDIKIANLSPLSGPVPTFGDSTTKGFQFAVDEWNEKGGVDGHNVVAIVEDSQCTADPAVNAANKVIDQDGVGFIVGEVCSSASIPVSEIAEEKGVVQISPTSTNPNVTLNVDGSTKDFVYRACFIDPFQGLVMAKFAADQGYTKAFVMLDQGNDYVRGLAEQFQLHFVNFGGEIVGVENYTGTDTDFSAILAKVADSGAEVLYLPDYYNVVNLVAAQAKQLGVTAAMMGGDGWDSADLDLAATDGYYYSNHYSPDDTRAIVQDWVAKFEAKHGAKPDALATLAYDATNFLLAAIEAAGTDDPTVVAKFMETFAYEAVSGTITFDEFHNPIKSAVVLQVKDGAISFVASVAP